jgi:phosphonate transport system substrate-binding protein
MITQPAATRRGRGDGDMLRFATFLAPTMLPVYQLLANRIARRLDRPVQLVVGASFDQFARGEADLGVICGLPYVRLAARHPAPVRPLATPVLAGRRYAGRPVYYSDVIVHRDSPATRLDQLAGCSWAYNDPDSHSGHTLTLYELVRRGLRPGFFDHVVQAGSHHCAIRLVARGDVDATAIDSQVLAVELRDHLDFAANLRVIEAFGPSTIQPVVAAAHLPDHVTVEVRDVLVTFGDDPNDPAAAAALAHGLIQRFDPIDDTAYHDIRAMLATIHATGWTSLAQHATPGQVHHRRDR